MSTHPIYSDAQLMAFADGELPPAEAARLRSAALNDAALSRRIQAFSSTGRELGALFASKLNEPVPDHLLQLLQTLPAAASSTVRALPPRAPRLQQAARWWPHALAASLLVALAVTLNLPRTTVLTATPMLAGLPADAAQISAVLEATPSGEVVALTVAGHPFELLPTATFRDATGRYCREFTASDLVAAAEARALACRGERDWNVELATTEGRVDIVQDEGYFPAGADSAVEGRVPVDTAGERQLIENGWR